MPRPTASDYFDNCLFFCASLTLSCRRATTRVLIETDSGLWIDGSTSFYPIEYDRSTIESEFDKKYGKEPRAKRRWGILFP